jgi:hypothetical protein
MMVVARDSTTTSLWCGRGQVWAAPAERPGPIDLDVSCPSSPYNATKGEWTRPARGSWPQPTVNAGGWSATSTTASSSGSSRSRCGCDCSRVAWCPAPRAELLLADARNEPAISLQELRDLARGIHPAILGDRGLPAALDSLTARAPLPVELSIELNGRPPEPVELAAYYLVSEALTNVLKHSDATTAGVSVARRDAQLVVEVADDGAGGASRATGSGLDGLTDRIEMLGGQLEISSPPGAGTTLRAEIPLSTDGPQTEGSF